MERPPSYLPRGPPLLLGQEWLLRPSLHSNHSQLFHLFMFVKIIPRVYLCYIATNVLHFCGCGIY